ncbi:hypothetical protein KAFR_0E03730 [Kazachstania africana CBS 2517]|uniref:Pyruvate decarboxylase n=1 Tax=Kazachstania africana (strain ATCC 22294 / BCRC 22015 / CBS 2517 / CECT 1963 / NBRC 1671 / NRRL Y-8276) TaxID=1071382 RepID=H2AVX4_KAZAF|nr:hypothetical protein KAFR_0E03730 [Kazachstania africana CBS 2517]CCF58524.1 hypothetical protein KAFR_0E03730 [Kazachstania africana CBS 2517]
MAPVTLHTDSVPYSFQYKSIAKDQIRFGEYIFQRILSCGTKSVFGVPGDFNLPLLEYLYDDSIINQGLRWIGTCNELNAAYAADGYSRYSQGIGCLITTYGVGELSAMNGIAGAFAENVKLLHIVGVARSIDSQHDDFKQRNLHHLVPQLNDSNFSGPNHKIYYEMVKDRISCSTEYLENIDTACDQVDKVIMDIYRYSKPGYIFVPCDFVNMMVDTKNLLQRPKITFQDCILQDDKLNQIDQITNLILDQIYSSKSPAIIGDVLTDRYHGNKLLNEFITLTKIWNFTTFNGKSIINEQNPYYMGLYNGNEGAETVIDRFLKCDLIINVGIDINEINHGHYTFSYRQNAKLIEMHPTYIRLYDTGSHEETLFKGINFIHVLKRMLIKIDIKRFDFDYDPSVTKFDPTIELKFPSADPDSNKITQNFLAQNVPDYLNDGDVLVVETGAFQFATRDFLLPDQLKYITQGFYLSIGTALPAALGVGIAMQDYPRCHLYGKIPETYNPRLILMEGDGAAQMTVQELSSFIRYNIPIEIILLNNDGYTIERAILGPTRSYNDIMAWNWTKIFEALGDFDNKATVNTTIKSPSKLLNKFKQLKNETERNKIEFIEVILGVLDYPEQLKSMVEAAKVKKPKA